MTYLHRHAKRNPATGELAFRTAFDELNAQLAGYAWVVVGDSGARNAPTAEVSGWDDIYAPEVTE